MNKVMDLSDANNRHLREVLEELMLVRATARLDKRPVHSAIRERCQLLGKQKHPSMINAMLEQIRRKTLCEHELLKCVTTYNELVRGELEMIRDGELVTIKGNQAPIE